MGSGFYGFLALLSIIFAGTCLIAPRAFTSSGPSRVRLSIGGIIIYVIHLIFAAFPDAWQVWIVRVFGVLLLGLTGFLALVATDNNPFESRELTAQEVMEAQENDPDMANPEYQRRLREEGPAYVQRVIQIVQSKRPDWYLEPGEEPMSIELIERETLLPVHFEFKWAFYNNTPAEERAQIILDEGDNLIALLKQRLKSDGDMESVLADQREKYGHLLPGASTSTAHTSQPPAIPSLEQADRYLQHASQSWRGGDIQAALESATMAWKIRNHHLGPNHPKTLEVQKMIQTAQENLN